MDGSFDLIRSDSCSGSLTVAYSFDQSASTAVYGDDFALPWASGAVTLARGQAVITLPVVPEEQETPQGSKSVVLRVDSGDGYTVGTSRPRRCGLSTAGSR